MEQIWSKSKVHLHNLLKLLNFAKKTDLLSTQTKHLFNQIPNLTVIQSFCFEIQFYGRTTLICTMISLLIFIHGIVWKKIKFVIDVFLELYEKQWKPRFWSKTTTKKWKNYEKLHNCFSKGIKKYNGL